MCWAAVTAGPANLLPTFRTKKYAKGTTTLTSKMPQFWPSNISGFIWSLPSNFYGKLIQFCNCSGTNKIRKMEGRGHRCDTINVSKHLDQYWEIFKILNLNGFCCRFESSITECENQPLGNAKIWKSRRENITSLRNKDSVSKLWLNKDRKKKKSDERPLTPNKKDQFAVNKKAKSNLRNSKLTTM